MNEDFLHYVWQFKLFSTLKLQTIQGETVEILKCGMHHKNAGPDFLNAQLKINGQLWVGNVEIHVKSSDWYAHNHEEDKNYDAVILHVVWEHNVAVFMVNNKDLPTLVLKDVVHKYALKKYRNLFSAQQRWIPCENEIASIDKFTLANWLERLFFERLERKSLEIKTLLIKENNNFETVLFQLIAKNFGLKVNGDSFFKLATSFDFSVLRKVRFSEQQLAALLFGQAGFLDEEIQENYYLQLKTEYAYLKHKFHLKSISKNEFSFFRMRPNNFPTIRIAELVSLFFKHQNLFSKIIEVHQLDLFYALFSVEVHPFWKTHYTFDKVSSASTKKITKPFIDLLLINTVIPLQFLYQKSRGEVNEKILLELMQTLNPEKNSIISKFSELKISSENALETQALLELKNNYCATKRCLECAIGKNILSRN
ncbi:MAG: DUF2851 family protein [Polaribacter sp.]